MPDNLLIFIANYYRDDMIPPQVSPGRLSIVFYFFHGRGTFISSYAATPLCVCCTYVC
jgi:hypothetical protein